MSKVKIKLDRQEFMTLCFNSNTSSFSYEGGGLLFDYITKHLDDTTTLDFKTLADEYVQYTAKDLFGFSQNLIQASNFKSIIVARDRVADIYIIKKSDIVRMRERGKVE